jgi:hypothetical protein
VSAVLFVFILDIYDLNKKFLGTIEQMVPHIEQQHHDELQMGGAFEDVVRHSLYHSLHRQVDVWRIVAY